MVFFFPPPSWVFDALVSYAGSSDSFLQDVMLWSIFTGSSVRPLGGWASPFVRVNRFGVSFFPLPLLFHQPVSWESLIPRIIIFFWECFAMWNPAGMQTGVGSNLSTSSSSKETSLDEGVLQQKERKKKKRILARCRNNPSHLSTSGKIGCVEVSSP